MNKSGNTRNVSGFIMTKVLRIRRNQNLYQISCFFLPQLRIGRRNEITAAPTQNIDT